MKGRLNKGLGFRLARLVAALAAVTLVWACNAPFIPVPPPGAMFTSALVVDGNGGSTTVWTTSFGTNDQASLARIFIFDVTRGAGVIAQAKLDGSYVAPPMEGTAGDHVEIYLETPAGDRSATACLLLVNGGTPPSCAP